MTKITLLMTIPLLGFAILPNIAQAYAASDCDPWWTSERCYGWQALDDSAALDISGIRYDLTISDMSTSTNCDPNGNGFALTTIWTVMPDNELIEIGVASGQIDGTCYDSEENEYLVYEQDSYNEFKLSGSVSPDDVKSYEISDTNTDKTWKAYTGTSERASLIMNYDYALFIQIGTEGTDKEADVPSTDMDSIQYYQSGWNDWTTNSQEHEPLDGWIKQCTPNYEHIAVGIGGTETC